MFPFLLSSPKSYTIIWDSIQSQIGKFENVVYSYVLQNVITCINYNNFLHDYTLT